MIKFIIAICISCNYHSQNFKKVLYIGLKQGYISYKHTYRLPYKIEDHCRFRYNIVFILFIPKSCKQCIL